MLIPDYKTTAESALLKLPPTLKPLPELAAVTIHHSYSLLWFYRCSYGVFAIALSIAFYSYVLRWPALFPLVLGCCWGVWYAYRLAVKAVISCTLSFTSQRWVYQSASAMHYFEIAGAVLCWPWLIILPFREVSTSRMQIVLIFNDSLNVEDRARLRRWLLASLVPRA